MKPGIGTGAQEGNRTPDLRITSALLYRLSYLGRSTMLPRPDWSSSGAADRPGNCG
jgi:hypothetical protein